MSLQSHIPWQDGKSLVDAAVHLYMKPTLSDVTFTFSKEENATPVPAHKFVLAMRSSEFENMFYNSSISPKTVDITEIEKKMFLLFLKFLYTDDVALNHDNVNFILIVSYKFQVTKLTNLCQKYLLDILSPVTACAILEISGNYKMDQLQRDSLAYIEKNTSDVLQSKDLLSLSLENLKLVLSRDALTSPEKEIFEAVMRWASAECKQSLLRDKGTSRRFVLGDALYQIRIPTMSMEEYSQVVVKSGVLTDSEELAIFRHIASGSVEPVQKFVTKERTGLLIVLQFSQNQPSGYGMNQRKLQLNLNISLQSKKAMKSMVVDLTDINRKCRKQLANKTYQTAGQDECLILQININGVDRDIIRITEMEGPLTVNIKPTLCLNPGKIEIQISLWRSNCSNCNALRCELSGDYMNGKSQDKDIQISFRGNPFIKGITFT